MRMILLGLAAVAATAPAAAQAPVPRGDEVAAMAPAIAGAADAMLELDVGPLIDAADPWRRHPRAGRRTLRDMARRDDPYFDRRLRSQIYGTTAAIAGMIDAFAAAEPALRRSMIEMERNIDVAVRGARRHLPPAEVDDDWDRDLDEPPYEGEPYEDEPEEDGPYQD